MLLLIVMMVSEEILEFSFKQLIIELDELTGVRSLSSSSASLNRPLLPGCWWMRLSSDGDRFGACLLESK